MENRRVKIVAIDDNTDNLITLRALINEAFPNAEFYMETNGVQGIELVCAKHPDVVLLDLVMPGMDGFEVCKRLKSDSELCDIPVVFLTAIKGDKEHRIHALNVGAEAFLAKPIDETELIAQIRAMVKIRIANVDKKNENERLNNLVALRTIQLEKELEERKRIMADLVAAKERAEESDRLKSAFLANMSHEIRTPMNGILGFSELLELPDVTGEEQKEYIKIIQKSGKRMLNLLNDIIDISKIESGMMKVKVGESNLNNQMENVYNMLKPEAEAKHLKLSYVNAFPLERAYIKSDKEKVYSIITNLVKNAIKYTDEGMVEYSYQLVEGYADTPPHLLFHVKDTGLGIPKERQAAIFERFIQADIADTYGREGAGLGLSITKAYVEMLGGTIGLESEEGKGSLFYFTIPYNAEPGGVSAKQTNNE